MARLTIAISVPPRRAFLLAALEALVTMNRIVLQEEKKRARIAGTRTPQSIYERGVRYARERRDPITGQSKEEWRTIDEIERHGVGDCEDLAAARCAELRESGVNARPFLTRKGNLWHVQVQYPGGRVEDPSKLLGMQGDA